jgi:small subunit ribosomal protein S20
MRQRIKRRMHNRVTKKVIKTVTKRAMSSLVAKDLEKAAADLKAASAKIDKAGARRVLHPNTAARRKSKLARAYNAALAKAQQQG